MKKVLLLLLALTLFNCSNDDDSQSGDPIVGEWTMYRSIYYDYEFEKWISYDDYEDYEDYELRLTFSANGTYSVVEKDDSFETSFSGKWEKMEGNFYKMTEDGESFRIQMEVLCSNNILKYGFFEDEISYAKKKSYDPNNCDIDYEDEL